MTRKKISAATRERIIAMYPILSNQLLAVATGLSKKTIDQYSHRYGLKKCEKYIQKLNTEKSHFYHYPKKR